MGKKKNSEERISVVQNYEIADSIDPKDFFCRMLANWKLVVCMALIFAAGIGAYTRFFISPKYEATATIYVLSNRDSAINIADLQLGSELTQDYIKVFKMWEIHEEVISNLDLPYTYSEIQNMLAVKNESGTRMLDITATSLDPQEAADIANEYAGVASQYIADTMSTEKPNIMSAARVPVIPTSPSLIKNTAVGFALGAILGGGYIFIQMLRDDKYKTAEDIRKYTGLVTLALVPVEPIMNQSTRRPKTGGKA